MDYNPDINILIADDNKEHIEIASRILSALKFPIRVATNGETALSLVCQKKPTLILLDIGMPSINGFELCRKIKENSALQDIIVIFITASHDEESITKGFSFGAQDYILKPYNSSELLLRVKTHLSLAIQKKKLQTSYDELNTFCHTVSHDLKSPVLIINQLVGLLKERLSETLETEDKQIITRLQDKSSFLIKMIERLLDFSKLQASNCNFEKLELTPLFTSVLTELISLEPNRNIEYSIADLKPITADKFLITNLIQNIFVNSIKFTVTKNPAVITVIDSETFTDYSIIITDNGIGFDNEHSKKAFEIFERLHTQAEYEGTGVGLAIVKKIMERHGGSVSISSEKNIKTSVTLTFPKNILI